MGSLLQDSSRLPGWVLSALLALMICAAPSGASDGSPANWLPVGVARADLELEEPHLPLDTATPTTDLAQKLPEPEEDPSTGTRQRQSRPRPGEGEQSPIVVTRKVREGVLKSDFEKVKQDAAELTNLAKSLQDDLEKTNEHILSLKIVEKAQKIESLAKSISKTAKSF